MEIRVQRLDAQLPLPTAQHDHDAGYDLHAREDVTLAPGGGRAIVPTGIVIAVPPGYAGFVLPRSGLALHRGVSIINTPCTIDSDYRGEIRIPLINFDREPQEIAHGERIAQLLLARVVRIEWVEVSQLPASGRGSSGFGSTGAH